MPHGWCHMLRCLGAKVTLLIRFGMEFWFCRFSANPLRSSTSWWYVGWCHVWDIVWFSFSSVRVKSGVLKDV